MLASLLPGVRELRAPLAAGFLWLFALWLAIEPEIPAAEAAEGTIWASLAVLREETSEVAFGAAVAFAAYLLGALSEAVRVPYALLWHRYGPKRDREKAQVRELVEGLGPKDRAAPVDRLIDASRVLEGAGRPMSLSDAGNRSINQVVKRTLDRVHLAGIRLTHALRFVHPDFERFEHRYAAGDETAPPAASAHVFLRQAITREAEATRTRLQVQNADLFSKVDRLRSEAEFRLAVMAPLVVLGFVVVARTERNIAGTVVGAAMWLAAVGLCVDGWQKRRTGDEALAEALAIEEVESPTVARLNAITKADDPEAERFRRWQEERPPASQP